MSSVFISYRRDDSAGFAGRLFDFLGNAFPGNTVFIDVDGIDAGLDFVEALNARLASCEVLLAVIGSRWLETASDGTRRIDEPDDYVRLEIETALRRNIRVIPVLVGGAAMPSKDALPDALEPLTRRNALDISHARFAADAQRLVEILAPLLSATRSERVGQVAGRPGPLLVVAGVLVVLLPAILLLAVFATKARSPTGTGTPTASPDRPVTARADVASEERPTPAPAQQRADAPPDGRRPEEKRMETPAPIHTETAPPSAQVTEARPRQVEDDRSGLEPPQRRSAPSFRVLEFAGLDSSKARIAIETDTKKRVVRRAWCERLTVYTEFGNFSLVDWHPQESSSGSGVTCVMRMDWKNHRTETILANDTSPLPGALNETLEALCPETYRQKLHGCSAY